MTFLAPWRLGLLAAPLALLVAYAIVQRARHKVAVRFTSVDLLASVLPRRAGWQRHIPAGALLLAAFALVVGFAQPARIVRTPRRRATVMLVLDTSGSMTADDVIPTRLAAAQQAARHFVNALPPGVQLGLVPFSTAARVAVAPTSDRAAVLSAIDRLRAGGGTATGDAIDLALEAIAALPPAANGKPAPAAVVLMSDGMPTIGRGDLTPSGAVSSAAADAKRAGVPITTIAFGTQEGTISVNGMVIPVPSDPAAMARIASATGGQTFTARTASQLESVYDHIGRAVGYDVHHREITVWFTGIGLALAILAGVFGLIWNQRLI